MFIEVIDEGEAQGALADWYGGQRRVWGFLPDYAGCFSARPEVGHAWAGLNLSIRDGMDRRRYEVATLAARAHEPAGQQAWDALVGQAIADPTGYVDAEAHRIAALERGEVLARWAVARAELRTALREVPEGVKMVAWDSGSGRVTDAFKTDQDPNMNEPTIGTGSGSGGGQGLTVSTGGPGVGVDSGMGGLY